MSSSTLNLLDIAFSKNNGYISKRDALKVGISESTLRRATKNGQLQSLGKGVYKKPYVTDDVYYEYSFRYSKGIFSAETALYLHGLNDRLAEIYDMTFPKDYNTSNLPQNVRAFRESDKFYGVDEVSAETTLGNIVKAYSVERTLCDILRSIRKVERSIIASAYKNYFKNSNPQIEQLYQYARLLGVRGDVAKYVEVLS